MAKIIVRVPIGDYAPLRTHVEALGKTLSQRARELLLADMTSAATPRLSLREFCEKMSWKYPLPKPGTPEGKKWLDECLTHRED